MNRHILYASLMLLVACGGSQANDTATMTTTAGGGDSTAETAEPAESAETGGDEGAAETPGKTNDAGEFAVNESDKASRPNKGTLKATKTEAAIRFFVVDKDKGDGIPGIVISLTAPGGKKYYTKETQADGFAEVLVPIGQDYDLVYLSLGRRNIAAKVKVADTPNLNLKLTMRYKREDFPTPPAKKNEPAPKPPVPRFVLKGVQFDSGKASLTGDSHARLDVVVEYMTHKPSSRIEVSGHTDNVGKAKTNKKLSQQRADAVRAYLISKGIDGERITAIGYGSEKPIASNDTEAGRQENRRIEATELE